MIIEFKVANYRSIGAEQTLSFVADRATRHPDNLIRRPGYRLLKAVGLFGANASGKSNLVKALGAMAAFVRDSATKMNDGDAILAAEPYRLDPATRDQPSRFEITFAAGGTVYTYGFAATRERVWEEWLSAKPETSEKELFGFHRRFDPRAEMYTCEARMFTTTFPLLILQWTRDNALSLSVGAQRNFQQLLPVYRYIRDSIETHDMSGPPELLIAQAARRCKSDARRQTQLISLLRDADTGIESMEIDKPTFADILAISNTGWPERSAPVMAANRHDSPGFTLPITTTRRDKNGDSVDFDFKDNESRGTGRFFAVAVLLLDTLEAGAFLVLDEIDASMHPLLTRRLLELFQSPQANPNGAQLLFTTHDAVLLDTVLFRRDQIVLAEKWEGASAFFSLADIEPPIRNTESFLRNYLAGRYGGTPQFGRAFEDVAVGSKA